MTPLGDSAADSEREDGAGEGAYALSAFSMIKEALRGDKTDCGEGNDTWFGIPLATALSLLSPGSVKAAADPATAGGEMIDVEVPDIYKQLAAGRVVMKAAALAFFIPSHLLTPAAFEDKDREVMLPLRDVVNAVGSAALRRHTARKTRLYEHMDRLSDPFTPVRKAVSDAAGGGAVGEGAIPESKPAGIAPPVSVPDQTRVRAEAEPVKAPTPTAASPAPAPELAAAAPPDVVPLPAADADVGGEYQEFPGNVNVNTADLRDLMTLDGVSEPMAMRILEYRREQGPFRSIFDLCLVPRLGRKTFHRMTGMPHSLKRLHRSRHLVRLLRIPLERVTDLAAIARTVAGRPGFSGCVISDADGLLLAQASTGAMGENLSAVVPRIDRQVQESMNVIDAGHVDSISICIRGHMYTVVLSNGVAMTAIHEENRVTKTQLALIRKVGHELAWMLSHRAYAA